MAVEDSDDAAARAFEDVRAEVTLLRRAVERLTAERSETPESVDYSETLGQMSQSVSAIAERIGVMAKSPALSLTPDLMVERIKWGANEARRDDQRLLGEARAGLDQATRQIAGMIISARTGDAQNRWLIWSGLGGTLLGILLWAACAGPLAHLAPGGWQWPERMAARTLRMSMWDAGQRLMATASLSSWTRMVANDHLGEANEATIAACRRAVARTSKSGKCLIEVTPEASATASHGRQP